MNKRAIIEARNRNNRLVMRLAIFKRKWLAAVAERKEAGA
jgi:hypothetical protein